MGGGRWRGRHWALLLFVVLCPRVSLLVWAHRRALVPCPHCRIIIWHRCLSFGCHVTAGDVAPGFRWASVGVLWFHGGLIVCCRWYRGRGVVGVMVCCGDVVVGWPLWFVVVMWLLGGCCGLLWWRGRQVVAWLLLASSFEMNDGVLTMIVSTEMMNDDIVVIRRLVATLPMATWHLLFHWCGRGSFAWWCGIATSSLLLWLWVMEVWGGGHWWWWWGGKVSWTMMVVEKVWALFVDDTQIKRRQMPTLDLGIIDSVPQGPSSHSCGNKKGEREKFPKRKEEKREKRISLDLLASTVTLSYDKKIQKIPRK